MVKSILLKCMFDRQLTFCFKIYCWLPKQINPIYVWERIKIALNNIGCFFHINICVNDDRIKNTKMISFFFINILKTRKFCISKVWAASLLESCQMRITYKACQNISHNNLASEIFRRSKSTNPSSLWSMSSYILIQ